MPCKWMILPLLYFVAHEQQLVALSLPWFFLLRTHGLLDGGSWAAPPFWLVGCCRASPRLWFAPAHRTRWRTRWACRRPNPPTNLQRFSWSWRIRCHQIDPQILVELAGYTVWDLQQKLWICHGFQMGKITLLIAHPPLISGLGFKEKGEFGI